MARSLDADDRSWFIVSRWQQFRGEGRANLLRVIALAVYYGVQVVRFLALKAPTEADRDFQRETTIVVGAWSLVAVAILICLQRGIFPAALKYLSTAADVILLTLLAKAGHGASGPLVYVYFLIVALAALRFDLSLVWCATLMSMTGYLSLVASADSSWFDPHHATPVIDQLIMLASLALTGIALGQLVRQVRALTQEYARRLQNAGDAS